MIISCPNCNKNFNIDQSLIPDQGRLLQCSNCMHKWNYIIKKTEDIVEKKLKFDGTSLDGKIKKTKINSPIQVKKSEKNLSKQQEFINKSKKVKQRQKKKDKPISLLNMIVILVISMAAIITILETFRIEFSKYLPFLYIMLNSFYVVIADINSFIKDLVR